MKVAAPVSEQRLMEKGDLAKAGVTHIEESRRRLSQTPKFHFGQARHQMYKPEVQRRLQKSKESPQVPSTQRAVKTQVWVREHRGLKGRQQKGRPMLTQWVTHKRPTQLFGGTKENPQFTVNKSGERNQEASSLSKTAHKSLARQRLQSDLTAPPRISLHSHRQHLREQCDSTHKTQYTALVKGVRKRAGWLTG